MGVLHAGEQRSWRFTSPRFERRIYRALSSLLLISALIAIFRDKVPFSGRKHVIIPSDIVFESSLSANTATSWASKNGFLQHSEAHRHCSAHNWTPYLNRSTERKIYDLTMINTELDWLEIRLNELSSHVSYFIVLESPTTFTGLPKPLIFKDNWSRFANFSHQIIHHILEPPTAEESAGWNQWNYEKFQRDAMYTQVVPRLKGIQAPQQDDIILVSDLDEIPRPATLTLLRNCIFPARLTLRSRFFYYGFQFQHIGTEWAHPQATTYTGNTTILPQDLRGGHGVPILATGQQSGRADLWNAGWHCSSCFRTVEEMLVKMQSFSHKEYNLPKWRSREGIVRRVREGRDLWDRWGEWYRKVDGELDVPRYVREQKRKGRFGYLVDREGEGGGFEDYNPMVER